MVHSHALAGWLSWAGLSVLFVEGTSSVGAPIWSSVLAESQYSVGMKGVTPGGFPVSTIEESWVSPFSCL